MVRIRTKDALGALVVALLLLFISNYFGNTLIPLFKANHAVKINKHDWIQWPKLKNKRNDLEKLDIIVTPPDKDHKSAVKDIKIENIPSKSITVLLSSADPVKGKKITRKCIACHSFKEAGKNKIGPNLYGIMGRERGKTVGFNYSKALKKLGGKWGYTDMDKFLLKPKDFLPGTKMSFKGIKSANDRAAVIMYLRSFAKIPFTLPEQK